MSGEAQWRPVYHFTPPANFINDPNGLVFLRGEYHLFYQHNPFGATWGHMSWGHAISRDLVRWEHLPVALWEEDGVMIFSGSAVVDWRNTSGFGRGAEPLLIAIYTGHTATEQAQCIAYSLDAGRTWTKYAGNPVLAIGSTAFRDPKVFWHAATQRWIMVVVLADEHRVRFYASPDLLHWQHLSDFGPAGSADGVWECPDLFPLAVADGDGETRWVLKVDVGVHAGPGREGAQYFVGQFDGERFLNDNPPETALWVDGGADFYAAQSWSDIPAADGRRLWLAWMSNWRYANVTPTAPWRGAMTAPRQVLLRRTPAGLRLAQRPAVELTALREAHFRCAAATIGEANRQLRAARVAGDALEVAADFRLADGDQVGLRVRQGQDEETVIGYDAAAQELFVDRTRSGKTDFSPHFPARHAVTLPADAGRVRLHVLVDHCSVEVFAGSGHAVLTDLIFPSPTGNGLELFGAGRAPFVERLEVWQLKTT
ncbi:MAG: glycoside hydrolase family 32 protein [Anaerolineae bacterium]|nr:glycoside hydrolase family 32 protein [Anaerolineae bacterium]